MGLPVGDPDVDLAGERGRPVVAVAQLGVAHQACTVEREGDAQQHHRDGDRRDRRLQDAATHPALPQSVPDSNLKPIPRTVVT